MSARIYGINAVAELVESRPSAITVIYVRGGQGLPADVEALVQVAREKGLRVESLNHEVMASRAGTRGGTLLAAEVRVAEAPDLTDFTGDGDSTPLLVVLDGVTDPYNLGAIVRSAAAFGADALVVPKRNSAPLNDAAVRASAGAVAHMPVIRVTNLSRSIRQLRDQGIWTIASTVDAEKSFWECDLTLPTAIVIGAEGKGVRHGVVRACDFTAGLTLPSPIGSLNASVFTGIALAIAARSRKTSHHKS